MKKNNPLTFYVVRGLSKGRGDRIRTCGRLVPNQERYRAALHPECFMGSDFLNCGAKVSLFSVMAKCFSHFFILDDAFPLFKDNNATKKGLPLREEQTLDWNNIVFNEFT